MLAATALVTLLVLAPSSDGPPDGRPGGLPTPTTTALAVREVPGGLELTARVQGDGRPQGSVTLAVDGRTVAVLPVRDGKATLTTGALADAGALTAAFAGEAGWAPSAASPVALPVRPGAGASGTAGVTVSVTIPVGALTIGPVAGRPDLLRVTDTRAGERGFTVTATLASTARGALPVTLEALQVPGYVMRADDVSVVTPLVLRPGRPTTVATYPAHAALGSVDLRWSPSPAPAAVGQRAASLVWTVL